MKQASIRFLHASPSSPAIDIYANGALLSEQLGYKYFSNYSFIKEGQYRIDLYESGYTEQPLYSTVIPFIENQSYTLAITTSRQRLHCIPIIDDVYVPRDEVKMRFIHLSEDTLNVDIAVTGGDVLFPNLACNEISDYMALVPMKINMEVRTSGTRDIILPMPHMTFQANEHYTIYLLDTATYLLAPHH
jgi:hypothetical protein